MILPGLAGAYAATGVPARAEGALAAMIGQVDRSLLLSSEAHGPCTVQPFSAIPGSVAHSIAGNRTDYASGDSTIMPHRASGCLCWRNGRRLTAAGKKSTLQAFVVAQRGCTGGLLKQFLRSNSIVHRAEQI
jgi:hypothetical protein